MLKRAAVVLGVLLGLYLTSLIALHYLTDKANRVLVAAQGQQAIRGTERTTLTQLIDQRDRLRERQELLQSLRGGMSAQQIVLSVEGAVPADAIWFTDWQFVRQGIVTSEQSTPQPASLFFQNQSAQAGSDWRIRSQMKVRGQARDHAALSEFSRSLLELPHVYDVKLQRTALATRQGDTERLVNFDLSILIENHASPIAAVASPIGEAS